LWEFESPPEHN